MSQSSRFTRRSALQLAGLAGIAAVANPRFTAAQEAELPTLTFTGTDFAFELAGEPTAGWTRVTFDNQGMMDHHVMLLKLHDDGAVDDLLAALQTPDFGAIFPLAASVGGASAGPGLSSSVVLDLAAGEYVAICAVPDDEGVPHYALGMQLAFTVADGEAAGEAPVSDLRIELVEMTFANLPTDVPAGAQVWEVANTGEQLHEMLIFALAEGMSVEQGMQIFGVGGATPEAGMGEMAGMDEATPNTERPELVGEASPEASPSMDMGAAQATPGMEMGPPFMNVAGVAPMSPGNTNYLELDLAAGSYIAICFVPDMETGMPHFMMGMIAGFTVA